MNRVINRIHFDRLKSFNEETKWAAARPPRAWAQSVDNQLKLSNLSSSEVDASLIAVLSEKPATRMDLKAMCADAKAPDAVCLMSIMAWGGMKVSHGALAWGHSDKLLPIVREMRAGALSRTAAYSKFHQFRAENPASGIGPAYYTKLIFFACPSHDGYIMDQWTSLSINLLFGVGAEGLIRMQSGQFKGRLYDRVSDANSAETYESYCLAVEALAAELSVDAEEAEMKIFSQGRGVGEWRNYLRSQLSPLKARLPAEGVATGQ